MTTRPKGGRRRSRSDGKLVTYSTVQIRQDEYEAVRAGAEKLGISLTELIRTALCSFLGLDLSPQQRWIAGEFRGKK